MIRIQNIILKIDEDESLLKARAAKKADLELNKIKYFKIIKKSIDARDKGDIRISYIIDIDTEIFTAPKPVTVKYKSPEKRIAIIGFGPAGMFAGLSLARAGLKPVIIERGSSVDIRQKKVSVFETDRQLDTSCNIQYGEGGAGTFSDGKLNTGVNSPLNKTVLEEFVKHGAPEEILYTNKPHIGSDNLPKVVKSIREEIINLGGEVYFDTTFKGFKTSDGKITSVLCKNEKEFEIEVSEVILAIGHSSRDTFKMLFDSGVMMEPKDMAIGLRIEHKQKFINKSQFGRFFDNKTLGAADYKLTSQAFERGVFTFCMCPGGTVVAATSEEGAVVTNGMSNFNRDGENANSAVVVQIKKSDYGEGTLAGIDFQRKLERAAYVAGGSDYSAPAQLVGDFLRNKESKALGEVKPSYPLGVKLYPLNTLLPQFMTKAIQSGIQDMDRRLNGFANYDAVLTGIETRTSSPVRVIRGENLSSVSLSNLYPSGEVGYAGGIMSSAMDGLKIADCIKEKYKI